MSMSKVSVTTSQESSPSTSPPVSRTRKPAFRPRNSHFDRHNEEGGQQLFRGFWTLFWIMIFAGTLRILLDPQHAALTFWQKHKFAHLISRNALVLAASDFTLIGCSFLSLPFAILLKNGTIPYYNSGLILQHILQTLLVCTVVVWTFYQNWYWVQSGYLTLHALSMLMKLHSYIAHNGAMSHQYQISLKSQRKLDELIDSAGGLEPVIRSCKQSTLEVDQPPRGREDGLRQRKSTTTTVANGETSKNGRMSFTTLARLGGSENEKIAELSTEILRIRHELTTDGPERVEYPENLTLANFFDYLLVPTLVYEMEYPRTHKIRPLYLLEKVLATFGTFTILILIVEYYILPVSETMEDKSFLLNFLDLAVPFMVEYLLIFFIIFECICTGFAEITCFSDREFYQDWWNSTSFDEFSRRWNVPVHTFLLKHVYNTTIDAYRLSKFHAAFVTFLLSALVHEMVMIVVTKKFRLYLFVMQMCQLPMIMFGRLPVFRKYPAIGNLFFWLGLLAGFPLLAIGYLRY